MLVRVSSSKGTAILLLLSILYVKRFTIALEVFHGVEKTLALLTTRNRTSCLATSNYRKQNHVSNQRRNIYPMDLFGEVSSDSHYCFFENLKLHQETHFCSGSRFICPLKEKYIPITMAAFENASSQVCHSLRALKEHKSKHPVNLILFGGSVTGGQLSGGCLENSCTEVDSEGVCVTGRGYDCAWYHGVVKYLQHRYENPKNLNVVDLSVRGTSSCTLPYMLAQKLESANVTLSSRDLVLYDYSVNDGVSLTTRAQLQRLRHCIAVTLERLAQHSQDGSAPAVILLEYFPFKSLDLGGLYPDPDSYTKSYREVAKEFHLPVISYRDLFWHPMFREDLKHYPRLEDILEFKWAEKPMDMHPPWVGQYVYADVVTGALHLTHQLCHNRMGVSLKEIAVNKSMAFTVGGSEVLLNQEATTANTRFLTAKEVKRLPYGWHLYQDRLGKPGWIVEGNLTNVALMLNASSVPDYKIMSNASHVFNASSLSAYQILGNVSQIFNASSLSAYQILGNVSQIFNASSLSDYQILGNVSQIFNANSLSDYQIPSNAALVFNASYEASSLSAYSPATLEVTYMQTYRNAGAFRVVVCETFLTTPWPQHLELFDTLIDEHYSNLDVAVFEVDLEKLCLDGFVEVKILHENLDDRLEFRGNHKVKITSVRLTAVLKPPPATTSPSAFPVIAPKHQIEKPTAAPTPSLRSASRHLRQQ
jgi:hypothetical protein